MGCQPSCLYYMDPMRIVFCKMLCVSINNDICSAWLSRPPLFCKIYCPIIHDCLKNYGIEVNMRVEKIIIQENNPKCS